MEESCSNASKLLALEHQFATFFFFFFCGGCFLEGRMSFDLKVRSQALRTNIYERRMPRELSMCVPREMLPPLRQTQPMVLLPRKEPLTTLPSDLNEFSLRDFLFR